MCHNVTQCDTYCTRGVSFGKVIDAYSALYISVHVCNGIYIFAIVIIFAHTLNTQTSPERLARIQGINVMQNKLGRGGSPTATL